MSRPDVQAGECEGRPPATADGRDGEGPSPSAPPASAGPGAAEWIRTAARRIIPDENPAGVVVGVILIGALLAAESGHHEGYPDTVASAAIAAALYWLAHGYAGAVGRRIRSHERLSASMLWRSLMHDWGIVVGAAVPLAVLLVSWATGAALETAVAAALWGCVAALIALELAAGIGSSATAGELALDVGVGATMGLAILALKALLR